MSQRQRGGKSKKTKKNKKTIKGMLDKLVIAARENFKEKKNTVVGEVGKLMTNAKENMMDKKQAAAFALGATSGALTTYALTKKLNDVSKTVGGRRKTQHKRRRKKRGRRKTKRIHLGNVRKRLQKVFLSYEKKKRVRVDTAVQAQRWWLQATPSQRKDFCIVFCQKERKNLPLCKHHCAPVNVFGRHTTHRRKHRTKRRRRRKTRKG